MEGFFIDSSFLITESLHYYFQVSRQIGVNIGAEKEPWIEIETQFEWFVS